jgi:NADPH:quinone reductase-like Zn-dependent oxidoreductase
MKVLRLADSPAGQGLVEGTAEQPQPGRGELLIRVFAAGITPTELSWYPTSHNKDGKKRIGAVPGHEFSGVIANAGEDTDGANIGDEVFGMNDWFADGATAEYCIAPYSSVARKPRSLTHTEAASVPIGTLTAWQGLFDRAKLKPGERVLVHGGAGAVGVFAVQLATLHGAHVTATASARDFDFVMSLGAEKVIDYRASRFEDEVHGLDVVFDTVGGETLGRSWSVLNPLGRMVTVAASEEPTTDERTKQAFFIVEPNRPQLTEIGGLLDAQQIRTFVAATVPLSQAAEAYSGRMQKRGTGKIVVVIADDSAKQKWSRDTPG